MSKIYTDEMVAELRARNEQRLKEAKEKLGTMYLCHETNRVKRIKRKRSYNKTPVYVQPVTAQQ